jgi:hypothetical protein
MNSSAELVRWAERWKLVEQQEAALSRETGTAALANRLSMTLSLQRAARRLGVWPGTPQTNRLHEAGVEEVRQRWITLYRVFCETR